MKSNTNSKDLHNALNAMDEGQLTVFAYMLYCVGTSLAKGEWRVQMEKYLKQLEKKALPYILNTERQ